jgi:UDPglucose 6-dehydrogenase
MKIGIIGFGYVGRAVGWAHSSDELVLRDPKLKDSASLDKFLDCDGIYICVPSPSTDSGQCDYSILEQTLKDLLFILVHNPNIVVISKTTATPSVYKKLQDLYPALVHAPEFLTQKDSINDYANAKYCVLGGNYDSCIRAQIIIQQGRQLPLDQTIIVTIETAALYKYMMNSYLAAKVTFMNDFKKLADAENVDWKDLTYLSSFDERIGNTHMNVPGPDGEYGWGGACFPKDVNAIIYEAVSLGVDFELIDHVNTINKKHRTQV